MCYYQPITKLPDWYKYRIKETLMKMCIDIKFKDETLKSKIAGSAVEDVSSLANVALVLLTVLFGEIFSCVEITRLCADREYNIHYTEWLVK